MLLVLDTKYVYFATTTDGRIISIVPLDQPYLSRAEVVTWAADAAQKVMRFAFSDYRQRLQDSANSFTPTGWESFTKALKDARTLEAVEARKLVVTLLVEAAPDIKKYGVNNGVYYWDMQFPVTIKYEGNESIPSMRYILTLRIVRVSTLQNPSGVSIEQWIMRSP